MIAEKDVQTVSDMRLIALVMQKRWSGDSRYYAEHRAMTGIAATLTEMLANGPESGRLVIEPTVTVAALEDELRKSVFGGRA